MSPLETLLKQYQLRLTKPRKLVFETLLDSQIPLALADIVKSQPELDRTSTYRALLLFDRLGIVSSVHIGQKSYYELAEPFTPHHHHLYCIRCKNAEPIQIPELEQLINNLSAQRNFSPTKHYFELEGVCSNCRYAI